MALFQSFVRLSGFRAALLLGLVLTLASSVLLVDEKDDGRVTTWQGGPPATVVILSEAKDLALHQNG